MLRAGLMTVATIALLGASLFAAAGSLDWPMAWAFLATFAVFSAIALPLTYLPILIVANDPGYMGAHVNGRVINALASVVTMQHE